MQLESIINQTHTLLPLERFRQDTGIPLVCLYTGMPLLLLFYLYIAASLLTLNESYTDQPYLKEYELSYIHC